MKKKFALLCAVAGVVGAFSAPSASFAASCRIDGDSRDREIDPVTGKPVGPSGEDYIVREGDTPTGTIVYSDQASYLGVTGSRGYIEVSDDNGGQIDGTSSGGELYATVNGYGVCLNGTYTPLPDIPGPY